MNQRWRRRLHDEVTCHWLCQLTPWLVPDPITWLSIAAHPPTLGSLRPVPVGSQHHIITDFLTTLSQVSSETMRTENMSENSQKNPFEKADWRVLPGLAAILRHLAASGESGLVTSCYLWSPAHHGTRGQWSGDQGPGGPGGGSGASGHLGHETRGGFWGWREAEAGVCGPEPGSGLRPGPVTGSWGCGPRPLLPTLSSGHIAKLARTRTLADKIFQILLSTQMCFKSSLLFSQKFSHSEDPYP